jgi:hypothetical protein
MFVLFLESKEVLSKGDNLGLQFFNLIETDSAGLILLEEMLFVFFLPFLEIGLQLQDLVFLLSNDRLQHRYELSTVSVLVYFREMERGVQTHGLLSFKN